MYKLKLHSNSQFTGALVAGKVQPHAQGLHNLFSRSNTFRADPSARYLPKVRLDRSQRIKNWTDVKIYICFDKIESVLMT